jgi:hypothetical protein
MTDMQGKIKAERVTGPMGAFVQGAPIRTFDDYNRGGDDYNRRSSGSGYGSNSGGSGFGGNRNDFNNSKMDDFDFDSFEDKDRK